MLAHPGRVSRAVAQRRFGWPGREARAEGSGTWAGPAGSMRWSGLSYGWEVAPTGFSDLAMGGLQEASRGASKLWARAAGELLVVAAELGWGGVGALAGRERRHLRAAGRQWSVEEGREGLEANRVGCLLVLALGALRPLDHGMGRAPTRRTNFVKKLSAFGLRPRGMFPSVLELGIINRCIRASRSVLGSRFSGWWHFFAFCNPESSFPCTHKRRTLVLTVVCEKRPCRATL
jgi:hypothetical protein